MADNAEWEFRSSTSTLEERSLTDLFGEDGSNRMSAKPALYVDSEVARQICLNSPRALSPKAAVSRAQRIITWFRRWLSERDDLIEKVTQKWTIIEAREYNEICQRARSPSRFSRGKSVSRSPNTSRSFLQAIAASTKEVEGTGGASLSPSSSGSAASTMNHTPTKISFFLSSEIPSLPPQQERPGVETSASTLAPPPLASSLSLGKKLSFVEEEADDFKRPVILRAYRQKRKAFRRKFMEHRLQIALKEAELRQVQTKLELYGRAELFEEAQLQLKIKDLHKEMEGIKRQRPKFLIRLEDFDIKELQATHTRVAGLRPRERAAWLQDADGEGSGSRLFSASSAGALAHSQSVLMTNRLPSMNFSPSSSLGSLSSDSLKTTPFPSSPNSRGVFHGRGGRVIGGSPPPLTSSVGVARASTTPHTKRLSPVSSPPIKCTRSFDEETPTSTFCALLSSSLQGANTSSPISRGGSRRSSGNSPVGGVGGTGTSIPTASSFPPIRHHRISPTGSSSSGGRKLVGFS